MRHRQKGFTLLEMLVAVGVFEVASTMIFGGLQYTLGVRDHAEAAADRMLALQKAFLIMQQDFEQIVPRGIRDQFGDVNTETPLQTQEGGLAFTRGGKLNPLRLERSALERAGYTLSNDQLIRKRWLMLDQPIEPLTDETVLLEDVRDLAFRFMGPDQRWIDHWPPLGAPPDLLPRAVEVSVETAELGVIPRIFVLPY